MEVSGYSFRCIFRRRPDVERSEASSSTCSSVISPNVASAGFVANVDQVIVWKGIVWDGAQGIMFRVRIFTPTQCSRFLSIRKVPHIVNW